jgi:hypothetical protein
MTSREQLLVAFQQLRDDGVKLDRSQEELEAMTESELRSYATSLRDDAASRASYAAGFLLALEQHGPGSQN